MNSAFSHDGSDIAVIGMACRFPGAAHVDMFWRNLRDGVESISFFRDEELIADGANAALLKNPNYVKAGAVIRDIEKFDASFFNYNPREAELIDPQQRVFLECAVEALEQASYNPETYGGLIGVYAGIGANTYLLRNLFPNDALPALADVYQVMLANEKDFLTTRVSYNLNLKGPSVSVQTACSTSLVAVHLASQSLVSGECDIALAGGVAIHVPQLEGYLYQEGMIDSPDGHCRAFDAKAQGTVRGSGAGIVVLKRLADAIADRDNIYAVIKGSAINNDGSLKVGYTAPGLDGQAEVIAEAQAAAGIDPETIRYVEAHGTATALGDPIEVAALTQAFGDRTRKKGFCALGSVKTNIGHLDTAAGVAGFIKTVLVLKHGLIPPSLHYEQPNPKIDFANSPFYVNTVLSEWKANGTPRRAGVSSFGIGGTNAHVVLEEAPALQPSGLSRPWKVLVLSAKTSTALDTAAANLADQLQRNPEIDLADVAYTLAVGRRAFNYRRVLVCRNAADAASALHSCDPKRVLTFRQDHRGQPVVFMFSGQGAQYVNMGQELYDAEPVFREEVDRCCEILKPYMSCDLRRILYPSADEIEEASERLEQTAIAQAALFVVEYALASVWAAWGVSPQAMIGHSIGEYVAACLAGVFSLEEALRLVAARGRLMQQQPRGVMLTVPLSERDVLPLLGQELSLAAVNGPLLCVVSGSEAAVASLEKQLAGQGVEGRRLHTSHAFHSRMMDPAVEAFAEEVKKVRLNPPRIRFVSNVTGTWITAQEATDPGYWARHLRECVRFNEGISLLLKESSPVFLEVGPGQVLSTLTIRHPDKRPGHVVHSSLHHPQNNSQSHEAFLLTTLGKLWLAGVSVDWRGFYFREQRQRLPLPTYPFERRRYWIEPPNKACGARASTAFFLQKKPDIAEWFYIPSWKRKAGLVRQPGAIAERCCCLVFIDECGVGAEVVKRLEQQGQDVIAVRNGLKFTKVNDGVYTLNSVDCTDYDALLKELRSSGRLPKSIIHLWGVAPAGQETLARRERVERANASGFYSLLFLTQALEKQAVTDDLQVMIVTNNMQDVTGEEVLCPEKATVLGPCRVIPQEYMNIRCRSVDIVLPATGFDTGLVVKQVFQEFITEPSDPVVAYRGPHRWVQIFDPLRFDGAAEKNPQLRQEGVYLITGGLGKIGLVLAEYLAKTVQAKLILLGRSALPAPEDWLQWLAEHDKNDETSRKIRKMRELEELGAKVLVVSADVADEQQMKAAIARAEERFGHINGVLHAAGVIGKGTFRPVHEATKAGCEQHFQPKIFGLLVLEEILRGRPLDFCLLVSSLSSVLGGLGLAAYSAANLFMDAFVYKHNQRSTPRWTSINWDGWQLEEKSQDSEGLGLMIAPQEGVEIFQRILSRGGLDQVVISIGDLSSRIVQWVTFDDIREGEKSRKGKALALHPRPNLSDSYVAPRTEVEKIIAEIWHELLGIEQIGIYDNFLDLGGHSLLATQISSRLRKAFKLNLPLAYFFENPTVAGFGENLTQYETSPGHIEAIVRAREKMKRMSPKEIQALLQEKKKSREKMMHE